MRLRSSYTSHVKQFLTIGRNYWRLRKPTGPLKLHLGCGHKRLPGFINIDFNYCLAVDYVCDISKLPCPDHSAERIEAYHVIEHIPFPVVGKVLSEWKRVLLPGGTLVLECPDLEAAARGYLQGNERMLGSIFGYHRFKGDAHCWGYTSESLGSLLESVGFTQVRSEEAQDYHAAHEPCIRMVGQKAGKRNAVLRQ
jgi:predicted SAM-dependent methyltransferase